MNQARGRRRSFLHPGIRAVVYGLAVLLLLFTIDQLSIYFGLRESERVLDDIGGAFVTGLLVYRHESVRLKFLTEKLKTIEMMNHHVRNALQVIVDSAYIHGHAEQLEQIRDSVGRIDWALREILPGRVLDQYHEPGK
jgi:hypothetical protein